MQIRKAQRHKAKLRLGIAAPSGAGKTYSSLLIAFGIGGKVGIVDTENGSADLYAHLGNYDVITLSAPYEIKKYLKAIKTFEENGYDTIIIDSLSHAWAGDGGLLDKVGKMSGNSYANWRHITPEHNSLVEAMLQSSCHIIATMRAKTDYVLEENDKGKQTPKKVGLAPVQREGMDYEFTVMFDLDIRHNATSTKDRTGLFDGRIFTPTKETGVELLNWLNLGTSEIEEFITAINNSTDEASLEQAKGIGRNNWQRLSAVERERLMKAIEAKTETLKKEQTNGNN
jgi:hypothetical protein